MKRLKQLFSAVLTLVFLGVLSTTAANAKKAVILGGVPFGLTMYTNGVIVVNVDESYCSPAQAAGIKENDVITRANGEEISSNEQLKEIISSCGGEDIELSLTRGKSPISLTLTPEKSESGTYTAGMWVRDSTAGLGTVTYFDESTHSFGALGHGINDRDTGMLLPLRTGKVVGAEITSADKALSGTAGGLNGYMTDDIIGEISVNNGYGVFGRYDNLIGSTRISVADEDQIHTGGAQIYCTVDHSGVHAYDIEIEQVNIEENTGRNMIIRVTDPDLMEKTGGIVQGMSGSPIVQDNRLVGAVTHVFVNSPERGYGISVENMMESYKKYGGY